MPSPPLLGAYVLMYLYVYALVTANTKNLGNKKNMPRDQWNEGSPPNKKWQCIIEKDYYIIVKFVRSQMGTGTLSFLSINNNNIRVY